jgi:hypothetical protein
MLLEPRGSLRSFVPFPASGFSRWTRADKSGHIVLAAD